MDTKLYYDKYGYKAKYLTTNKHAASALTKLSKYEGSIHKDLCEFDFDTFKHFVIDALESISVGVMNSYVTHFKNYLDDCKQQKHESVTFSRQEIDRNVKNVSKWLKNLDPKEIIEADTLIHFNDLNTMEDSGEFYYQHLALCWLAFVGLSLEQIVNIRSDDIYSWKNYIRKDIVSDEIINRIDKILIKANNEKVIKYEGNKGIRHYVNLSYLIRTPKSDNGDNPSSTAKLFNWFRKLDKVLGKKKLSFKQLQSSGQLYFGSELLKKYMQNIICVNDSVEFVINPIRDEYQLKYNLNSLTKLNRLLKRDILNDYYQVVFPTGLKKAFNRNQIIKLNKNRCPNHRNPDKKTKYDKQNEQGARGERIVVSYLQSIMNYTEAYLVPDGKGYDIYAENKEEIRRIEVKTMTHKNCWVNLTINEFEKAIDYDKEYWVYILVLNELSGKSAELFMYKDFLSLLNLKDKYNTLFDTEKDDNTGISWKHSDFQFKLNDSIFEKHTEYLRFPIYTFPNIKRSDTD